MEELTKIPEQFDRRETQEENEYKDFKKDFDAFDDELIETGQFHDQGSDTFDDLPKEAKQERPWVKDKLLRKYND